MKNKEKGLTVALTLMGQKNANGRIYDEKAINKMMEDFKNRPTNFIGELGYPTERNFKEISLDNASHEITDLWLENKVLYGKVSVLPTPMGKKLKEMLDSEQVVFRSRCIGDVNPDGTVTVNQLLSFDAVPRENDAFVGLN